MINGNGIPPNLHQYSSNVFQMFISSTPVCATYINKYLCVYTSNLSVIAQQQTAIITIIIISTSNPKLSEWVECFLINEMHLWSVCAAFVYAAADMWLTNIIHDAHTQLYHTHLPVTAKYEYNSIHDNHNQIRHVLSLRYCAMPLCWVGLLNTTLYSHITYSAASSIG